MLFDLAMDRPVATTWMHEWRPEKQKQEHFFEIQPYFFHPAEQMKPPRACEDYWSEFRHCKSFMNRFHQYYAYGSVPSCHQWKEDYNNCREWKKSRSTETQEALQRSERKRVAEQKNFDPVWELRCEPPKDWHLPLNQDNTQDS